MTDEIPTPLTDAEATKHSRTGDRLGPFVTAEFARVLERELFKARPDFAPTGLFGGALEYKLNMQVKIDGTITQELHNAQAVLARWVMDTREEQVRQALIALGWTPPIMLTTHHAHAIGTCGQCGNEMVYNIPRMGAAGGFVHKTTGKLMCEPNARISTKAS